MKAANTAPPTPAANSGKLRVLERSKWFSALEPSLKRELLGRAVVRRFATHALVYAAGSAPSGLYAVLSGEVRLEHLAKSGKFAFYQALRGGDFFGMLSEIDGTPRFSDARAQADTAVLQWPHADCQDLARSRMAPGTAPKSPR